MAEQTTYGGRSSQVIFAAANLDDLVRNTEVANHQMLPVRFLRLGNSRVAHADCDGKLETFAPGDRNRDRQYE